MNPQMFLDEFGAVANAPGGVQRLREMVLQLAVMGKLVEQHPDDGPASELLKSIETKKEELLKAGELKKQKPFSKVIKSNISNTIPESWIWCRFGTIWELISGRDLKPSQYNDTQNGIPYITGASNIENSNLYINRWTESPAVISKTNDLLISCKGTIGKTAFNIIGDIHIARQIMAIRKYANNISRFYLKIWLDGFVLRLVEKSKSIIPGFSRADLLSAPFPLPPLEEQNRIVAKVDQLMALCDQLEAQQQKRLELVKNTRISALEALSNAQGGEELQTAWKRVEENLPMLFEAPEDVEDLKKCVLQNAVMGKLVPQDPNDEPASELLKKIAEEKAELVRRKEIKKQKPLTKIRDDEKTFEIPEGWEWCRLDKISLLITSGSRGWAQYYSNTGAAFLRMGNLSKNSFEMRLDNIQHVLPPKNSEGNRTSLRANDLLISITGDVGMLGLIPEGFGEAYINQHTAVMRPSEHLYHLFISFYCLSPLAQKQFSAPQRGLKNSFRLSDIGEMLFPLPPFEEQKRIVEKTKNMLSLCNTLQKQLKKSQKIAEQLAQSIVENITGISTEKKEKMKAPKTELVTRLMLVKKPGKKDHAPLSAILAKNSDELSAKALWNNSGLPIDGFYRQLKIEMGNRWIEEPQKAEVRIVEDQGKDK